jgi:hypothetical protein
MEARTSNLKGHAEAIQRKHGSRCGIRTTDPHLTVALLLAALL